MLIPRKGRVIGETITERPHHSSLILPFEEEKQFMMRVVAVGPEVQEVEIGDIAILPNHSGAHVKILDTDDNTEQRFYVIDEDYILAVFREDASE